MTERPHGADFRADQPEPRVHRMWRAIEARRASRASPRRRLVSWGGAAFVACVLGVVAFLGLRAGTSGALVLADGRALPTHLATGDDRAVVAFSDDSTLRLAPHTRLDVIESTDRSIGFALREGYARFSVTPHGPRRWRIDCGGVQVEVVGTVFAVQRSTRGVSVAVTRGAVVVRGDGVPDRVVRLVAGERVDVRFPVPIVARAAIAPLPPPSSDEPPSAAMVAPETDRVRNPAARSGDTFDEAIARHDFEAAFDAIGSNGIAARTARSRNVDELLGLADVARLSGHPSDARAPLARIVELFPSDTRAAIAAFSLGQIELGAMRNPEEAAVRFEQSLALGLPRSARETASARLVESLARAHSPRARGAAESYLEAYPEGRYRAEVERWRGP